MSNYQYNEPEERDYDPIPEADYDFSVVGLNPTYTNANGNFILPIEIRLVGTERKIKCWLCAGTTQKGKRMDMIAPFLKSIRRNPAVGEEPDFSSHNLMGAIGKAHVCEKLYNGQDDRYKGMTFPSVAWWVYDKDQVNATVSRGKDAKPQTYKSPPALPKQQPAAPLNSPQADDEPF